MFLGNPEGQDQPTAGPDRYTGFGFVDASKALVSEGPHPGVMCHCQWQGAVCAAH